MVAALGGVAAVHFICLALKQVQKQEEQEKTTNSDSIISVIRGLLTFKYANAILPIKKLTGNTQLRT